MLPKLHVEAWGPHTSPIKIELDKTITTMKQVEELLMGFIAKNRYSAFGEIVFGTIWDISGDEPKRLKAIQHYDLPEPLDITTEQHVPVLLAGSDKIELIGHMAQVPNGWPKKSAYHYLGDINPACNMSPKPIPDTCSVVTLGVSVWGNSPLGIKRIGGGGGYVRQHVLTIADPAQLEHIDYLFEPIK